MLINKQTYDSIDEFFNLLEIPTKDYRQIFIRTGFDCPAALLLMKETHLERLNVPLGHRVVITSAIEKYRAIVESRQHTDLN